MYNIVFGFKKYDYAGLPFTRLRTSDYIILIIVSLQSYIYIYHRIQWNIAAMLHSRSSPESVSPAHNRGMRSHCYRGRVYYRGCGNLHLFY